MKQEFIDDVLNQILQDTEDFNFIALVKLIKNIPEEVLKAYLSEEVAPMKDHETYFCLASDGLIYNLGDHGDYEAANATAESLGLEVIWMFREDTAQSWMDTLTNHIKEVAP